MPDSDVARAESGTEPTSVAASVVLDEPGRWTLTGNKSEASQSLSLLVTVAASESRTAPLPAGQLQALGMSPDIAIVHNAPQEAVDPAHAAQLDAAELESRQRLWRWLLLAGLGCLALEGAVSFVLEKRQQPELA